ncbi:CPBP family intramembrane metalloprotease [Lactobacillus sp. DCY120]|uniref:CPBP family intramembrane metalloprotease n=1 Tax=Bombilactobacillus apium TaxID=2675299 RepID=A0A850R463_9LACO|nr:type II CAAX endopeptidase family protein [Bombilactobacillus apium]NVY95627.1 CPBP family intramembrane metalloprotease [Bombilactobacillus apium]
MNLKIRNYLTIISHILAFIFLYILQQLPASFLLKAANSHVPHTGLAHSWLQTGVILLTIVIVAIMFWIHQRTQTFPTLRFNSRSWGLLALGVAANCLLTILLLPLMQATNQNVSGLNQIMTAFPIFFALYAVFGAPITEELLFRSYFINWFFKNHLYWGALISALLFGLLHISSDPFYFLSKFLLGLILGLIYVKSRNIKTNIALHFINNLFPILLQFLGH